MLVGCPKCKTRLKIADEKISPEGTKFKCPKCSTLLLIKPPVAKAPAAAQPGPVAPPSAPSPQTAPPGEFKQTVESQAREINPRKVLVAHENPHVVEQVMSRLLKDGYLIIPTSNGIEAQTQALKELPFLAILDAALPRITGYEILRRFQGSPLARDIKCVILTSVDDPARSPQGPASEFGAIAYLDISNIDTGLANIVTHALGLKASPQPKAAPQPSPAASPAPTPEPQAAPQPAAAPRPAAAAAATKAPGGPVDKDVEKARRLARTVLSDIDLYSPEKVLESVKAEKFQTVFAEELREGLKHYQNRIPQEVRSKGNFFQEAIDDFIIKKKKIMGIA